MQVSACTVFPSTDLAKVPLRIITNSKLPQIRALGQILAIDRATMIHPRGRDPIAHDWQVFTIWAEAQQNCESTCCRLGAVELQNVLLVFPSHKCQGHARYSMISMDWYTVCICMYLVCILYIVDDIWCILYCDMAFICRHIYIVCTPLSLSLSLCTCVQISALVWYGLIKLFVFFSNPTF